LTLPANKVFGDAPFTVSGAATSGLAVVLGVTGPCTINAGQVTITDTGTCTVSGDQPGDANFAAAPTATSNIAIGKSGQTITFAPLADGTYGDAPRTLVATASSG